MQFYTEKVRKVNLDYNPELINIPHSQRKNEWSCVGLMGQVHVRVNEFVQVVDYLEIKKWIGIKSIEQTNLLVMKIKESYSDDKGYNVALCLLK